MQCIGCGDTHIVIASCAPLCRRCLENTHAGGELGDLDDEVRLLSDFEMEVTRDGGPAPATLETIINASSAPETASIDELFKSHHGTFVPDF